MGTNYYYHHDRPCKECGRFFDETHIGKSSWGWCFALHVTDEIRNLDDWKKLFAVPGSVIQNEECDTIAVEDMLSIITERSGTATLAKLQLLGDVELGPNGLARSIIGRSRCIGHGEGTWDLIIGDFS